jgi:hypothetical protein
MVAYCGRCKRRKVVEYELPEEVKRLLLLYRWKTGVCLPCVDELAEKGGIFRRQRNDAIERISQDAEVVSVVGWRTLCPSGSRT